VPLSVASKSYALGRRHQLANVAREEHMHLPLHVKEVKKLNLEKLINGMPAKPRARITQIFDDMKSVVQTRIDPASVRKHFRVPRNDVERMAKMGVIEPFDSKPGH
jgi:hypothetical protein